MKNLTASDRASLIKLASSLPKGDETRKAILAGLKTASVLSTKARAVRDALEQMTDNLDIGNHEPGDYYTVVRMLHQFLIAAKKSISTSGAVELSEVLTDMTELIRLLQKQYQF